MTPQQFESVAVGRFVFAMFGNSYRRCTISEKDFTTLTVEAVALNGRGRRLRRRIPFQSVDLSAMRECAGTRRN